MKHKRFNQDITRRKLYKNNEVVQRLVKVLELLLCSVKNIYFFKDISQFYICNQSYKSQIKNFCIYSGRSRSVLRHYKVSRIVLRELSSKGYFFGMKKAS